MSIREPEEVDGTGIDLYGVAKWSRATIADGKWLQENTVGPLYENELILASAVYGTSAIAANDIASLRAKTEEICDNLTSTSANLQNEIDIINAGSDVIDVVGDVDDLSAYQGWTTENDVIKVLCDSAHDDSQTYYRWTGDDTMDPSQSAQLWSYVGGVSPYYTKSEIDTYSADARSYVNDVSGSLYDRIDYVDEANRTWTEGVSGSLYEMIEEASGSNHADIMYVSAAVGTRSSVELHGGTYVEVSSAAKQDGTISYSADLYASAYRPLAGGPGISIVEDQSQITISCSANSPVFLNLGNYDPSQSTLYNDIDTIMQNGNEPVIYETDNYGKYSYYYLSLRSYGISYMFTRSYISGSNNNSMYSDNLVVRTNGWDIRSFRSANNAEAAHIASNPVSGHLAALDSNGDLIDSGIPKSDVALGTSAYNALHGNQIVVGSLGSDENTVYFLFSNP